MAYCAVLHLCSLPRPANIYMYKHTRVCTLHPPLRRVSKYFAQDFMQRVPPIHAARYGPTYRDFWPSLFVGPSGSTTDLHVDAWCSNFWMAMLRGRKRWVLFAASQASRLYKDAFTGTFGVNSTAFRWLSNDTDTGAPALTLAAGVRERHPLAARLTAAVAVLEPGDLLFVPANTPHFVENLGPTLALSGNYVDGSNFECATRELRAWGLLQPSARALVEAFERADFDTHMDMWLPDEVAWAVFKAPPPA